MSHSHTVNSISIGVSPSTILVCFISIILLWNKKNLPLFPFCITHINFHAVPPGSWPSLTTILLPAVYELHGSNWGLGGWLDGTSENLWGEETNINFPCKDFSSCSEDLNYDPLSKSCSEKKSLSWWLERAHKVLVDQSVMEQWQFTFCFLLSKH